MKRIALSILVILFLCPVAQAKLINYSAGIIYDDVYNQYWIRDLTLFANQTFDDQLDLIDSLNDSQILTSDKWGDWRMAEYWSDRENLWSQAPTHQEFLSFVDPFLPDDQPESSYIAARWDFNDGIDRTFSPISEFLFREGEWGIFPIDTPNDASQPDLGAWIVADGVPVPVPATLLLFSTGIIGLVGKRKFSKTG